MPIVPVIFVVRLLRSYEEEMVELHTPASSQSTFVQHSSIKEGAELSEEIRCSWVMGRSHRSIEQLEATSHRESIFQLGQIDSQREEYLPA